MQKSLFGRHAVEQVCLISPNHVSAAACLIGVVDELLHGIAYKHVGLTARLGNVLNDRQQVFATFVQIPQGRHEIICADAVTGCVGVPVAAIILEDSLL